MAYNLWPILPPIIAFLLFIAVDVKRLNLMDKFDEKDYN